MDKEISNSQDQLDMRQDNSQITIAEEIIVNKIYNVRGKQVMLSHDLAELYQVETKVLNQQVKRNIGKFPGRYMFQLTQDERDRLRSQNVTLKRANILNIYHTHLLNMVF